MIRRRHFRALLSVLVALTALAPAAPAAPASRDRTPGFDEQSLALPGVPAAVIPADMNGDGRQDLVVLVAYTAWGDTVTTERATFDDVEGLVEVMNVVSALIDHRELRVYLGAEDGRYETRPATLELDETIHLLEAGAAAEPLVAVTDEGVAAVRYRGAGDPDQAATLSLVPLVDTVTAFTGSGAFFADYSILSPLDGDDAPDLVLPTATGWSIFRGTAAGFDTAPASVLTRVDTDGEDDDGESDSDSDSDGRRRPRPPDRPTAADQNGDGRPDLLLLGPGVEPTVWLNLGDLAFSAPIELSPPLAELPPVSGDRSAPKDSDGDSDDDSDAAAEIVHVGPLDGGRVSSLVSQTEIEPGEDAGMRVWIEHAKQPDFAYAVHPLDADLEVAAEPRFRFTAEGYTFAGSDDPGEDVDVRLPGGFQDLDGDGRQDLVAITLEFSILPVVMRALITRRLSLTMDFHPWCQEDDGSFRRVPGLDLSGRFKINLRNVQVKHLSQFAGDFNGDGRADFVQLGRGRKVTIHHGGPGCRYPVQPSGSIRLAREPRHLGLVRILDLDGDARSDLYVVHPLKAPKAGGSIPVRLDLYLSEDSGSSPAP